MDDGGTGIPDGGGPGPDGGGPASATLHVGPDVTVNGLTATRISWVDARGTSRSAALVTTPQSGSKGGFVEQFTYEIAGATRTVNGSAGGARGFGYVVSHLTDPARAGGQDDSPLGSTLANASRVVWAGPHHAIFEYKLNYPRWGQRAGVNRQFDMPVTIHWVFASGRSHPLWSATFDLSSAADGEVEADSRAPYGEMEFSGNPADFIGGVEWCDTYCFRSTSAPLTLNAAWDWSAPNTGAAFNSLFTHEGDAEMGIVATRVISRQDAGGYPGADGLRGATSATRSCPSGYLMPCDWQWSYQSVNYSFYDGNGNLATDVATTSKRLAWGTDWGYLGGSTYYPINADYAAVHYVKRAV